MLRVLAYGALGQVVGVQPHEPVVAVILSETLDGKLQLGQTMVLGGKLGARQKAKVGCLGLLTGHAIRGGAQLLIGRGAIGSGEAAQRGYYGADVWLDVPQVVFVGERTVAEYAQEGVSSSTLARLRHPDVLGQVGDEVGVWSVDDEFPLCLSADLASKF